MRKTILIFIAAMIAAAVSTPAAASFWDRCGLKRLQCRDHCNRHASQRGSHGSRSHRGSYGSRFCLANCDAAHNKCKIRESVTIPGKDILDNAAVFGSQGPSATGTPLGGGRAPSAPPVILR
jgi:hypothetical protein